jgi:inorganic pyrophosphatase
VKLKYDDAAGVFRTHKAMPVGFEFAFNFGFVPGTAAQDGDPLDVLLLSGHGIPVGTVVPGRILSVLEAEQIEKKVKNRNDRVIAIPWDMVSHGPMLPEISFDQALKHAIAYPLLQSLRNGKASCNCWNIRSQEIRVYEEAPKGRQELRPATAQ